jgi:ABC-type antimicrobial peptide transport system permease subunit
MMTPDGSTRCSCRSFDNGVVSGIALAAAAARVIRSVSYGIPFDLMSLGAGLLLFAAVAFAGTLAPARRVLRIDPASAIRYE